jgi:hypothetical protein
VSTADGAPPRFEAVRTAATELERDDPELVRRAVADCEQGAQLDHAGGVPRGKAYVQRLRDLTHEEPALGVAVARALSLEHIVEDLLDGKSVDGVTGLSPEGEVLPPSRSDRRRRRGTVLLVLGGVVLLVGATAADSLSLFWVIAWTVVSFALIFTGLREALHRG